MINKLKPKSEFSRNVLTLMTGTTIAQAIPIAVSPILTRLYTPEDFGVFALYMSITSIMMVVATARYELAIMLPKKDDDAMNIVALSILIAFFISLILFSIVYIFNDQITHLLGSSDISNWLYFIPITVFLTSIYQNFYYWENRSKKYKMLAKTNIIRSSTIAGSNLSWGWSGAGPAGLIVSGILGQGIAIALLGRKILDQDRSVLKKITRLKLFSVARRYIKFPKFDIFAALFNILAHQIVYILLISIFNSAIAGYYYLTQRILGLPITFIASAILDVFKEKAAQEYRQFGHAKYIYVSTFKKLFVLSFFPSILLYFFVVDVFIIFFGEQWAIAGEYAQILIPMFFIKFISSPLSFMFYISEKQQYHMLMQTLFLVSVFISFYFMDTAKEILSTISILFSCVYIGYLYASAKLAKVF